MGDEERRLYPRRDFDREAYCYVNGKRLDVASLDISVGGTFLGTTKAPRIPFQSLVGVVVHGSGEARHRKVYLFGNVVRHQVAPQPGVGVAWDRAITLDAPDLLGEVLEEILGIRAHAILQRVVAGTGRQKHVFFFKDADREAALARQLHESERAAAAEAQPEGASAGATSPTADQADAACPSEGTTALGSTELPVAPLEMLDPSDPEWTEHSSHGPLTNDLDLRRLRVPVSLSATMLLPGSADSEGIALRVMITALGAQSLSVRSCLLPNSDLRDVRLRFLLPVRNRVVPLSLTTEVIGIEPTPDERSQLELLMKEIDEGEYPGALQSYVRWLLYRDVAG